MIFAGTPHRGSDKTKWADFAFKFANLIGKHHSNKLTNALKQGSDVVQTLEEWFKQIQSNFHIFSFYEEKPVAAIGTVVEAESAKINCDHEKVRMLHGNHMEIVRYGDEGDNSYKKVKDAFRQIHLHDLSHDAPRDITQPPRRLSAQSSSYNLIEDARPTQTATNRALLEYQYSRLSLGSTQTLAIEEIVEPSSRPRTSDQSRPHTLSVENLSNRLHRASSATLATMASHNSHRSDHSARSNGSTDSATTQVKSQYRKYAWFHFVHYQYHNPFYFTDPFQ